VEEMVGALAVVGDLEEEAEQVVEEDLVAVQVVAQEEAWVMMPVLVVALEVVPVVEPEEAWAAVLEVV
jgi:hypothetical protein